MCGVEMCMCVEWRCAYVWSGGVCVEIALYGLVHSTNISTILRTKHLVLPLWWLEWWPWVGGHLLE